ncbi:MAG: TolC family protein [Elusimicrobia bacterium]|nr:TolC family protein [Elusimicrobiota bacterium]
MQFWLLVLLSAVPSAPAAAADLSTGTLRLADVLAEVARVNPELAAARKAWEAAAQVPVQVGAFDDPTATYTGMITDLQTKAGPMKDQWSVSQRVPFWGKRALRAEAAQGDAEVARQAWRAKALELAARTTSAFEDLYYLERTDAILAEQESVLRRVARVADKKYAVGKEPQAAVFRAQVELAKLETDRVTAQEEAVAARARLNALLDRPARAALASPEEPPVPKADWDDGALTREALASRPELLAARALEGSREAQRRLALRRWFPDFTVGFGYTRIGGGTTNMPYDGQDAQGVTVGLNLPLWIGKNRASVREARAREGAADLSERALADRTRAQVEDLLVQAQTHARLDALYEDEVLPQARAALDSTQSAYEADAAGFLDLLDSERALLRFELEQARHRADFQIARAELERVIGTPLDAAQGAKK